MAELEKETFIQIGVTALRSPSGEFLPAVPLYVKAEKKKNKMLTSEEETLLKEVGNVYADLYRKRKEAGHV